MHLIDYLLTIDLMNNPSLESIYNLDKNEKF